MTTKPDRIHIDDQPWARFCRVSLNGIDISNWIRGVVISHDAVIVGVPDGLGKFEDREVAVEGILDLRINGGRLVW